MRRSMLFLSVLVLAPIAGLMAQVPGPAVHEPEVTPAGIEELTAGIQTILDENKIPGATVALIARDHTIWAGGIGMADVAAGVEVTGDTLFRVGSISKSFTALSVLMLVEEGLIDLDAPIRSIVPEIEFTNRWEETDPVRIVHTLEHTAGFDDIHFCEYAKVDDPTITLQEGLAYNPRSRISRWKPGMHMSYSNSGPSIAAYVLEKVTGTVFEEFVQERVFNPLGMANSSFHYPANASLMAKGYEADGTAEANYDHIIIRPSGALNTTSREMARFIRMLINRGTIDGVQLVRPETITRMETPKTTLAAHAGYQVGYGLGNYASFLNGHLFHGHDGGITGFVSSYGYSSDLGLGYFVSINKPSSKLRDIRDLIGEYLTAEIAPEDPPTVARLADSELREVAGFYQDVTPRMQLMHAITRFLSVQHVTLENGKLFVKPLIGGERKEFIPVSATSFRFEDQPVASMFNVIDDEGNLIGQWGFGGNNAKVSGLWIAFQLTAAILTVVLMLSSVLFALVWVPAKLLRKMKESPLRTPLFPLLATLSLIVSLGLPMLLSTDMIQDFGTMTATSLTICIGTLVFAALTLVSAYTSYRSLSNQMSGFVRVHSALVTLACVATLLYLWNSGIIGLRTWAY